MLDNTDIRSGPYLGDGGTTFPVTFPFLANADIAVYKIETATKAVTKLALDSDYSVAGAGGEEGGAVTTVDAVPAGFKIVILRDVPLTQPVVSKEPDDYSQTFRDGDGVTVAFTFPVLFQSPEEINVYLIGWNGKKRRLLRSDYTIAGMGTGSGTVYFVNPPGVGVTVVIQNDTGIPSARQLTQALDRVAMQQQMLQEQISRATLSSIAEL